MKIKSLCVILSLCTMYYMAAYCCPYTAVAMYTITQPLDPELRCVDMTDTNFHHAYVHVCGHDLFLNPLREYGDTYRTYDTPADFIKSYQKWGTLYNPFSHQLVKVW